MLIYKEKAINHISFEVTTERLILRDLEEKDLPILIAQFAEPAAMNQILSLQSNEEYQKRNLKMGLHGQNKQNASVTTWQSSGKRITL